MRLSILLVAPALLVSGIVIWLQPWSVQSKLIILSAESFACLLIGAALHDHIVRPLQTLANVVGALREEDYSFRARLAVPNDALGELSLEVNALADLLAKHRTGARIRKPQKRVRIQRSGLYVGNRDDIPSAIIAATRLPSTVALRMNSSESMHGSAMPAKLQTIQMTNWSSTI